MALKRTSSIREIRQRQQPVPRRSEPSRSVKDSGQYGTVRVNDGARCLVGALDSITLTKTEWLVLDRLRRSSGMVVTREALLASVWGGAYLDATPLLHDAISRLRRQFKAAGATRNPIVTLHSVGYRLVPD